MKKGLLSIPAKALLIVRPGIKPGTNGFSVLCPRENMSWVELVKLTLLQYVKPIKGRDNNGLILHMGLMVV